jgi:hypothetical protein
MAQPDITKKTVDQTGYTDDTEPFANNYRNLYRQALIKNGQQREQLEQYEEAIEDIPDDAVLGAMVRYIYQQINKNKENNDE